jgi:hypothetical protein
MSFKIDKELGESTHQKLMDHFSIQFPDLTSSKYHDPVAGELGFFIQLNEVTRITENFHYGRQDMEVLVNGVEVFSLYEDSISDFEDLEEFEVFYKTPDFDELVTYIVMWDSSEDRFTRKQINNFKDRESISGKILDSIILD